MFYCEFVVFIISITARVCASNIINPLSQVPELLSCLPLTEDIAIYQRFLFRSMQKLIVAKTIYESCTVVLFRADIKCCGRFRSLDSDATNIGRLVGCLCITSKLKPIQIMTSTVSTVFYVCFNVYILYNDSNLTI